MSGDPKRRWEAQTWIALSSASVAVCALLFSVYQGWVQREFLKLSVQPRMTISFFYNAEGAGYMFGGTGIGYASLKTFEVLVDGQHQPNWLEMCHALGFTSPPQFEFVVPRPQTIFKPDSYNKTFWIGAGPQAEELKLKSGRIVVNACYCSIYDECWQVSTPSSLPIRVDSCPTQSAIFGAPPIPVHSP